MAAGIELDITERTAFAQGRSFGDTGPYERLTARVRYAVDPRHASNRAITDIAHAPVGEDGCVHFSGDLVLLKPLDMARGNRRGFFEWVNRGNIRSLQFYNNSPQTNDPRSGADAGDGFLMRRGYCVLYGGWQGDAYPGNGRIVLSVPVARDGDRPITGRVAAEFIPSRSGIYTFPLSGYVSNRSNPTASLDTRDAVLTRRCYQHSERFSIPADAWSFARYAGTGAPTPRIEDEFRPNEQAIIPSATDIFMAEGFEHGWIYELVYTAQDPLVLELGHAAVRDLVSFLRHDTSAANPLSSGGRSLEKVYGWGRSQCGRCIRDFIYRGYNADVAGRRVFDGLHSHVAGVGKMDFSRFGNLVISASRQYEDHFNPADRFPFSYARSTDHITGKSDAILKRPATDPLVIHTHTASEYWHRRASLVHTTTTGEDLEQPDTVRVYAWPSSQHWADPAVDQPKRGVRLYAQNIVGTEMFFKAALDNMDRWASNATPPPPSRVPRRADGTLLTYAQWKERFPAIPGVITPWSPNQLEHLDHGADENWGILTKRPPQIVDDQLYTVLLPAIDEDGNEMAGVRAPMVVAPLGTYTGWNLRARHFGYGAMHNMCGSYIPFPDSPEERAATRDPRKSVLERYGDKRGYQEAIRRAALELVAAGLMLEEDVERVVAAAGDWGRPRHDVML